jgi:hypothetical protein
MYIILKNQHCAFILSVFFAAKSKCAILCLCVYALCAGRPSLGAKLGLADDFPSNNFPITPPRNGNVGRGSRGLSESGF